MKIIIPIVTTLLVVMSGASFNTSATDLTAKGLSQKGMQHAELFPGLTKLCDIDSPIRDLSNRKRSVSDNSEQRSKPNRNIQRQPIGPVKVFDNLYFVGTSGVSSWVLETSKGLILIDSLNTNEQAKTFIEKGMLELGLTPADTKFLIIGHEHGDHYGGQGYFVDKYLTQVVMSDTAWTRMENNQLTVFSPRWGAMPKRDITVKDGDIVTLGDTKVQIYETPGHTPGTISLIFPVYDNGKKHMVALWGGTGLNYGPDKQRIQAYSDAAARFGKIAKTQEVDIFMSNHPRTDGSVKKLSLIKTRKLGQPHPFVLGTETAVKAFDMLRDCTQAQVLRITQQINR